MSERQIQQVKTSFCQIQPVATDVALLFYIRLAELDPGVRWPIPASRSEQAGQLAGLLPILVQCVEGPARLREIAAALGPRGRNCVRSIHYPVAVKALLWALEKALGSAFSPDLRMAWMAAYESLAATVASGVGPSDATPPEGICVRVN